MELEQRDRVVVVLVRTRNPSNIGAVARAMHDFGFSRLRVVNEFAMPFEAAKSAVDAAAVMAAAETFASVAEAVADCTLVVGTTAVGERDLRHELVTLAEAAPRVRAELRRNPMIDDGAVEHGAPGTEATHISEARCGAPGVVGRVALVFGSEKTGLSNDELSHCNWLLTVPMQEYADVRHPSMNLGQAVAVCLYELVREATNPTHDDEAVMNGAPKVGEPVTAAQLERITELLNEVMVKTEYTRRHAHNCDPAHVRRLVRRIGASAVDAPVWIGILKQVLWKLGGEKE
jgi:tRNA C32,U32 (ribose-2'-O)-methylase TrmJ